LQVIDERDPEAGDQPGVVLKESCTGLQHRRYGQERRIIIYRQHKCVLVLVAKKFSFVARAAGYEIKKGASVR
jgi:hypothetical protein